jgi:hypothetical protein
MTPTSAIVANLTTPGAVNRQISTAVASYEVVELCVVGAVVVGRRSLTWEIVRGLTRCRNRRIVVGHDSVGGCGNYRSNFEVWVAPGVGHRAVEGCWLVRKLAVTGLEDRFAVTGVARRLMVTWLVTKLIVARLGK